MRARKGVIAASGLVGSLVVASAFMSSSAAVATQTPEQQAETVIAEQVEEAVTPADVTTDHSAAASEVASVDKVSEQPLESSAFKTDPSLWVYDEQLDLSNDGQGAQELGNSAMGVTKAHPDELILAAQGLPSTSAQLTRDGYVAVFLDTNNDGSPDYATLTPPMSMDQDTVYSAPIFRIVNDQIVDTGVDAHWVRTSEAWGANIPWKTLGIGGASFVMMANDGTEWGDDYSPDDFGTYVKLAGVVGGAPKAPVTQRVAGGVPRVVKAKRNHATPLPRKTSAGKAITWRSTTPAVCRVSGYRVVSTGKRGTCQLVATSAGDSARKAMRQSYVIQYR